MVPQFHNTGKKVLKCPQKALQLSTYSGFLIKIWPHTLLPLNPHVQPCWNQKRACALPSKTCIEFNDRLQDEWMISERVHIKTTTQLEDIRKSCGWTFGWNGSDPVIASSHFLNSAKHIMDTEWEVRVSVTDPDTHEFIFYLKQKKTQAQSRRETVRQWDSVWKRSDPKGTDTNTERKLAAASCATN